MRGAVIAVMRGAVIAALVAACTPPHAAFQCADSTACRNGGEQGVCEADGFCSFADGACPSGSRYGSAAGQGVAGQCVPEGVAIDGPLPDVAADFDPLGAWSDRTTLAKPRYSAASVATGGRIYVLGGILGSTAHAEVSIGDVTGGSVAWRTDGLLPGVRRAFGAATDGQYVFAIGGHTLASNDSTDVLSSQIQSDGSLGVWTATTAIPTSLRCHSVAASPPYVYVIGGKSSATSVPDVLVGTMTSGAIPAWTAAGALSQPNGCGGAVVANGYLYVVGGCTHNVFGCTGGTVLADVQYAKINANGTLGAFATTTELPEPRYHHSVVASATHLLVVAGDSDTTKHVTTVWSAQLHPDGTLGTWRIEPAALPHPGVRMVANVVGGFVFVIDGSTISAPLQ